MHKSRLCPGALVCAGLVTALSLPSAWGRGEDVTHVGPSFTKPDFEVHAPNSDLSAWRMDCDVFGWSRDFSEVGAVASEVKRGPKGKHRGEVYMLIYKIGKLLPVHNVNVHYVTHADLPDNPIPLDDARDLMWTIEGDFLKMWPRRPKYERPKKAMQVDLLWTNVPGDGDLCTPHVGFLLHYKKATHFVNFVPIDITQPCALIRQTDKRIYWAKDDLAAAMVRFDLSPDETHEKSARFVVNAPWDMAHEARISLSDGSGGIAPTLASTVTLLKKFGPVKVTSTYPEQKTNARTYGVYAIAARPAFAALARYVAHTLKLSQCRFEALPQTGGPDMAVRIGVVDRQISATSSEQLLQTDAADPRALEPRHKNSDFTTVDEAAYDVNHPVNRNIEPSAMPTGLPTTAPGAPKDVPPAYLKDWQVH